MTTAGRSRASGPVHTAEVDASDSATYIPDDSLIGMKRIVDDSKTLPVVHQQII